MTVLTAEHEDYWRKSQKYEEAPYYFLYKAIIETENCIETILKAENF